MTPTNQTRKFTIASILLLLGLSILLCGEAYFGYRLDTLSSEQVQIKEDYSMSNNITFGLFSIDQWRDRIAEVVDGQVQDFSLTAEQKKQMQAAVEKQLHDLVRKTIAGINKPQKSIGGKLKKIAFNAMVDADDIQAQVPSFAKTIVTKVNSPASQKRLKRIATSKLDELEKQIYDSASVANYEVTKYVYRKYKVSDPVSFNKQITGKLASIKTVTYNYAYGMLACVLLALVLWWLMRKQVNMETPLFIFGLLFAFVLLAVGLTASIIEVDARIQSFSFMLLGQKVVFLNQVLFFQSKSILGVVRALVEQPKPDAVVIGVLIMLFVIILPVLRMVARGIHLLSPPKVAESKAIRYLAYEAGKWDMADVMVIGILMTYIGLNGILKSQLGNLNIHSGSLNAITENNTGLLPGYIIFVGYVVFAKILSAVLARRKQAQVVVEKG